MTTNTAQCSLWPDEPALHSTTALNPVTGDLFQRMQTIFEQRGITTAYQVDFYQYDRDTVENDMQVGDCWFWTLRECGTDLQLLNGTADLQVNEVAKIYAQSSETQAFFLIRIIAQGADLREITREQAIEVVSRGMARGHVRIPRRQSLRTVLDQFLAEQDQLLSPTGGLLSRERQCLKDLFGQHFNKGDESYIVLYKGHPPGAQRYQVIHFLQHAQPASRWASPNENQNLILRNCSIYRLTITSDYGHASIEEATSHQFRKRLKQAQKAVV